VPHIKNGRHFALQPIVQQSVSIDTLCLGRYLLNGCNCLGIYPLQWHI